MDTSARDRVLTEALSWQGTPWHHQGRVKGVGVDCLMFLAEVYERAGVIPHADPGNYARDWHMHRSDELFMGGVLAYADEVETPEPGDVAIFKFGRCYAHGAIVVDWPTVIHSYNHVGVRLQEATEGILANRPVKFFRVKT